MKKLIAAAVAAAVIAPASLMAAGPTLYGKIHTSVDMKDNNASGAAGYDEWSLNSNSSRIGVKGSEDLGNGMKVGYLIEWNVDMDGDSGGSKNLTTRNRAITLSGDWGTALAGKWDTPFKTAGRKTDLFGDQVGDTRNMTGSATSDNRAENVVAYVTPNMNGFSSTVAYVFDAGTCENDDARCSGDNSDASAWSFNAIYNNGPILVALGYVDYNDDGQLATTTSGGVYSVDPLTGAIVSDGTLAVTTANDTDNATAWRLGGAYTFGDFKVVASYVDFESEGFVKDNDPSVWTVGGSYKMGNNTIKLQYSDRDKSGLNHADGSNVEDGSDQWSIGLDHAMSKRTTVYAAYATLDNDDDSARKSWGGTNSGHDGEGAAAMGESADVFSVGIIHKF